jgi:hypothetical protein
MAHMIDLPAPPIDSEDAAARLAAYVEDWRRHATSTEPADRAAAEAAIVSLYRNVGLADPDIIWVPSPLAGALAYQAVGDSATAVRSPYTRGEIGTGWNRDFLALRDPFGFQAYVDRTAPVRIGSLTRSEGEVVVRGVRSLAQRTGEAIRADLQRRIPQITQPRTEISLDQADIDERVGEYLLGSSAATFRELVGPEVFPMIAGRAVRRAFLKEMEAGPTRNSVQAMQPGQFDGVTPEWAAIERVFGRPFYSPKSGSTGERERLALRLELIRSAGPWWALQGLEIATERPLRLAHDAEGRLHSDSGPALAYGDGYTAWFWHGVSVDREIIESPGSITIDAIDQEGNAERRRVMVERFGPERLVREGNAELVHEDETGRLWRRSMGPFSRWGGEEPIVMVEVLNSTPEPDGSRKTYFLRVPPRTETARAGVAWTFGLEPDEYAPAAES